MLNLGFSKTQSEALLNAKRWDARMALAWSHLTPAERKMAKKLDYAEYENYWPELDFLELDCSSSGKKTEDPLVAELM